MNFDKPILVMSKIECWCGGHLWFWPRGDEDVIAARCPACQSTFHQILQHEEDEKFVEWFMGQQI